MDETEFLGVTWPPGVHEDELAAAICHDLALRNMRRRAEELDEAEAAMLVEHPNESARLKAAICARDAQIRLLQAVELAEECIRHVVAKRR